MASDEVLVALINESVNAEHRARRLAAKVLLEVLRTGSELEVSTAGQEVVSPSEAAAVADEIKRLIAKYRLGGDDAPLRRSAQTDNPSSRDSR